jgi:hypothetical protein
MDELESCARKNKILNAIPTSELHRLLALMERVQLYPGNPRTARWGK